jgi:hypothetical protein
VRDNRGGPTIAVRAALRGGDTCSTQTPPAPRPAAARQSSGATATPARYGGAGSCTPVARSKGDIAKSVSNRRFTSLAELKRYQRLVAGLACLRSWSQ